MKFSAKEDIEAPIEQVFEMLSDFDAYKRQAMRRGIEVQRTDTRTAPGVGVSWHALFDLRGKRRDIDIVVSAYDRPDAIHFTSDTQGLHGLVTMQLTPLSPKRTRLGVEVDLKPKTLSARLLVQSLKLAKSNLTKRFKLKVADYAKTMETRYQSLQA